MSVNISAQTVVTQQGVGHVEVELLTDPDDGHGILIKVEVRKMMTDRTKLDDFQVLQQNEKC
jgi:hypothetical protein